MEKIRQLILENKAWALGHIEIDPHFFEKMADEQTPEILWISCADSRVPPNEIINARAGSLFVHRNIANLVYENDENLMSVIEYAISYLKIKYIIICGHFNCGGVKAAFEGIDNPRLEKWTSKLSDLKNSHNPKTVNELVEISVKSQVEALANFEIVKNAWKEGFFPKILGWVYDINTGLIKELSQIEGQK